MEYEEKEDEFDVVSMIVLLNVLPKPCLTVRFTQVPEEEVSKRKQGDEDIKVDVATFESIRAFVDSDEDGEQDEIYHLPTIYSNDDDVGVDDAARKKRKEKRKREREREKERETELAASSNIALDSMTPAFHNDIQEEFVEIGEEMLVDKKPKIW